jgi:hypothetical protein
MPLSSKKASQCSDKVRSGLDFSCSGSHCLKALPFTEGLPGILWIVTSPVRRLLLSQRLMVERETPKRSWTSFLGMPRSMAESTFSLRSFEYAFMDLFLYRSATYASRCEKFSYYSEGSLPSPAFLASYASACTSERGSAHSTSIIKSANSRKQLGLESVLLLLGVANIGPLSC